MAYSNKWAQAVNPENINLVMMAMVDVALELLGDPGTDATVAAYATTCLNSPWSYARVMTVGVVFEATSTSDADLKAAVETVFPAYAGVQAT